MKQIKVNSITLIEKDIVEITNYNDFEEINKIRFQGDLTFNLNNTLYLIGDGIAYTHKLRQNK